MPKMNINGLELDISPDANLRDADLHGANLRDAYLRGAMNIPARAVAELSICPEGAIIGWKKARNGEIVKLLIPADAKRSNATGRKCRASYAEVLEIRGAGANAAVSDYNPEIKYLVGETVVADKWDEDRWAECSNGIHFFLTREEAEAW